MSTNSSEPTEAPGGSVTTGTQWKIAVLAASVALVGALIGGGMTLVGTILQAQQQADQSRSDFVTEQRQIVYSEFLNHEQILDDLISDWASRFLSLPPGATTDLSLLDDAALESAGNELSGDLKKIEIIGSRAAYDAAERECQIRSGLTSDIQSAIRSVTEHEASVDEAKEQLRRSIEPGEPNMEGPVSSGDGPMRFVDAAKQDLGIPE